MIVDLIYSFAKLFFRVLIRLLPVEFINRLFWFMPGRLVVDILRWYGATIGENVKIMPPILFHNFDDKSPRPFENLSIGANAFLGRDCFLDLIGKITIEENAAVGMGTMFITHMNAGNSAVKPYFPAYVKDIVVRQGAYIGARAMLIAPVEVGAGALIGAGALVIHNIPAGSVGVGVPAKVTRYLLDEDRA